MLFRSALGRSPKSSEALDAVLAGLVDRVTRRMRSADRAGRTVTLRLRFDDFSRATRSHTLPQATGQTRAILITARSLMAAARPMIEKQGITMVGISVGNLENEATLQLALPFDKAANDELDSALDGVRDKFGTNAITRGTLLGRDQGLTVPMLPD